jgi:hypothetical protein
MLLRRFNKAGIAAFRDALDVLRNDPSADVPMQMLNDRRLTESVSDEIEVDDRGFSSRREAAVYLRDLLDPLDNAAVAQDSGLWTWLTLYYFDAICPSSQGTRIVKNDYRYVYESKTQRHWYRHLLHIAWRLVTIAPTHNRLFLDRPLTSLDQITERTLSRLYLIRIPAIFEALDRIYWDDARNGARPGIVDPKKVSPGSLRHRLPVRIQQLEKTFDMQSLEADQLVSLLGPEFNFKLNTPNA